MKSQQYSHDRYTWWEMICFVPLTSAFLPCFHHSWSYHKTSIPCRCSPSSCSPAWEYSWLGFSLQSCSHSLSPWSTCPKWLTCLICGPPAPPKWQFREATEKKPYCRVCLTHQLAFCRILSQWSSTGKHTPCCNLRVHWVMKWPSISRDPAPMGQNVSAHICYIIWLALLNPVFGSGKLSLLCLSHHLSVFKSNPKASLTLCYIDLTFQLCSISV